MIVGTGVELRRFFLYFSETGSVAGASSVNKKPY